VLAALSAATGHPVPRQVHECTVQVRLAPKSVVVEYRLDLDETTAQLDLKDNLPEEEWRRLDSPRAFYEAYTRIQGPLLADNLIARIDGRPLTFACTRSGYQLLDQLQCTFEFTARRDVADGLPHQFTFRDGNYDRDSGRVRVRLIPDAGVRWSDVVVADEALQARLPLDLRPGDDARLRQVSATVTSGVPAKPQPTAAAPEPVAARDSGARISNGIDGPTTAALLVLLAVAVGAVVRRRLRTPV
jgi:hypothetical protein